MNRTAINILRIITGIKTFPAGFLLLALSACHYSQEYIVINAQNQFSISIPSWLSEDKALKTNAPFQYSNHFRNFYSMGEVISKDTAKMNMSELMNANLNILRDALQKPLVSDSVAVNIGGLSGIRAEVFGKMKDENIYFSEVLLEGKTRYYHISIWTRGEERKLRFKEEIDRMLMSFKEI